jgi:hypothetical protein
MDLISNKKWRDGEFKNEDIDYFNAVSGLWNYAFG